jgi:hypothetical protein
MLCTGSPGYPLSTATEFRIAFGNCGDGAFVPFVVDYDTAFGLWYFFPTMEDFK